MIVGLTDVSHLNCWILSPPQAVYIYIFICVECQLRNGAEISARMRAVTSGVSTGGSLALAYKLLSWIDRQPVVPGGDLCQAFAAEQGWHWGSFTCGVATGIALYVAIEFLVTLKWAFCQWVAEWRAHRELVGGGKPSYRILS